MAHVYVLHFDVPLHHAQHYTGCTSDLKARLERHAKGQGARLMQVLAAMGRGWRLGGLFEVRDKDMRKAEREIKRAHSARDFCQLCGGCRRPAGTLPLDPELIPFCVDSAALTEYNGSAQ